MNGCMCVREGGGIERTGEGVAYINNHLTEMLCYANTLELPYNPVRWAQHEDKKDNLLVICCMSLNRMHNSRSCN